MSLVLGLETSCDETSVALLREDGGIAASVVSSQVDMHRRYGGVVPEIAARAHLTNLPPLLDEALERAGARLEDVGLVVATAGPGLVGALLVGLAEGRGLAVGLGVPFVPGHHIEGHALSPFLDLSGAPARAVPPRFAALVVSGGHSHVFSFGPEGISVLARTRDDAAGEAYDKVAKMAGLGYPGGPVVDRLARSGRVAEPFAVARFKGGSLDLSF
ncbi:MAG: tRNA (adenosine(37)-N6)-threonylcarbamoyltransferase complex transferase subunit TsaD, partial [Thermoanaerobaculia bacterium]|nr:tRNA (adenosine(37)-N6)-threonylcarbamoyltransferase complex transferase subunit TsaD [Thermoanaerobaculia bacterium]